MVSLIMIFATKIMFWSLKRGLKFDHRHYFELFGLLIFISILQYVSSKQANKNH